MFQERPKQIFGREAGEEIGRGFEKVVYEVKGNRNEVIGIYHPDKQESAESVKARAYLMKLLNELFPDNIPRVRIATTEPNTLIVDRVELDRNHLDILEEFQYDRMAARDMAQKRKHKLDHHPGFEEFLEKLEQFVFPIDINSMNYSIREDGKIQYVDTFVPWRRVGDSIRLRYNKENLEEAVALLEGKRKQRAERYLRRLEELLHEEENRYGLKCAA